MKSLYFDSILSYDENDKPVYDRPASAQDLRLMNQALFSNGVFNNQYDKFEVVPETGLQVRVKKGAAVINGAGCVQDLDHEILTLSPGDPTGARYDRIVLRFDANTDARDISLAVVTGTVSAAPVLPALVRNETVYELCLANIRVSAGATAITADNITDTRDDVNLCGWVAANNFDLSTKVLQPGEAIRLVDAGGNLVGVIRNDIVGGGVAHDSPEVFYNNASFLARTTFNDTAAFNGAAEFNGGVRIDSDTLAITPSNTRFRQDVDFISHSGDSLIMKILADDSKPGVTIPPALLYANQNGAPSGALSVPGFSKYTFLLVGISYTDGGPSTEYILCRNFGNILKGSLSTANILSIAGSDSFYIKSISCRVNGNNITVSNESVGIYQHFVNPSTNPDRAFTGKILSIYGIC